MDPLTISLLLAGGGALSSGIGSWLQGLQPYQDRSQGWLDAYNQRIGAPASNRDLNWAASSRLGSALWDGGTLDPRTYLQKATGYGANASDLYDQVVRGFSGGGRYTAGGMQGQFADLLPGLQRSASSVADSATSRAGESMEALAARQSSRALTNMQAGLASRGLFGAAAGPVAAAMSAGAQEPLMAAQTAINQLRSQAFMGAYNPMASFAASNIQNEPQALANIGQLYASLAGQTAQGASPLLQLLGQQSQQAFMAPDLQQRQSPLASFLGGLGGFGQQSGAYLLGRGWSGPSGSPSYGELPPNAYAGYDGTSLGGNSYYNQATGTNNYGYRPSSWLPVGWRGL